MRGMSGNYPEFLDVESKLGCNPARFLDQPVGTDGQTAELSARGLIRGLDDIEAVRAWVEVALGRGHNGGPRQQVVTWLNRRQAQTESDAAAIDGTAAADENDGVTPSATIKGSSVVDAEAATDDEPAGPTPSTEEILPATATTVATDGGAPSISRCPDCHGELTPEAIDDEIAHWCSYCGGFRKPIGRTA